MATYRLLPSWLSGQVGLKTFSDRRTVESASGWSYEGGSSLADAIRSEQDGKAAVRYPVDPWELYPTEYSASADWVIWSEYRTPFACASQNAGTAWTPSGGATLLECVTTVGDSKVAATSPPSSSSQSQDLHARWDFSDLPAGTLKQVRVKATVNRSGGSPILDYSAYLSKGGVIQTGVNKAIATSWTGSQETRTYTFSASDLATLGISASNLSNIGFALRAVVFNTGITGTVDVMSMQVAYTPMEASSLDNAMLPGSLGSLPSAWLKLATFDPLPVSDDPVLGIEVLVTAWTDDGQAVMGNPSLSTAYVDSGTGYTASDNVPTPGEVQPEMMMMMDTGTEIGIGDPNPGTYWYPLEVALSLDGVNPAGDSWYIYPSTTVAIHTCGAADYVWNITGLTAGSFDEPFSILIRRPVTSPATGAHYVSTAELRVTHSIAADLVASFGTDATLAGKQLQGVRLRMRRRASAAGAGDVSIETMRFTIDGAAVGPNIATGNNWNVSDTVYENAVYDADYLNGALSTLAWTADYLSEHSLGVEVTLASGAAKTAYIDQLLLDIAYTERAKADYHEFQAVAGSASNGYAAIFEGFPNVPAWNTVIGVRVEIEAFNSAASGMQTTAPTRVADAPDLSPGGGNFYQPLEVGIFTRDGVQVGEAWYIYPSQYVATHVCGGSSYLWATTFEPGDFEDLQIRIAHVEANQALVLSQYVVSATVLVTTTTQQGSLTMAYPQTLTEVVLLGAEATPGTESTNYRRLRALNYKSRPNFNMKMFRPAGEKMNAVAIPTREWGTGNISGLLDYNELPYPLEGMIGAGVHTGGVANQRNIHYYALDNRKRSTFQTFSLQRGEKATQAHRHPYLVHTGLQIAINTTDCQVSGSFVAQSDVEGAGSAILADGANEAQTLTITGVPTGGTFRLAFRGAETTDLAYNIDGSGLQTALQALSTIGAGNATVTGDGPYVVTFASALAGDAQPMITLVRNNLTGGTTPTLTIVSTTKGGWSQFDLVPVVPGHWNIYMADTQAGLTAGKLDKTYGIVATGIEVSDRYTPVWVLDRDTNGTYSDVMEQDPKFTANLSVAANSAGMALLDTLRAGATKWLRLEAVGPVIGSTTDNYKMIWEGPVKVADAADYGDEEGMVIYPWSLEWTEGPAGETPFLQIENGVVGTAYNS